MKTELNKDLLAAAGAAMIMHASLFFLNPSREIIMPELVGEKKAIEVSLTRFSRPKPIKPKSLKESKKVKIKQKQIIPKKISVTKPAVKKEAEKFSKNEIDEQDMIFEKVKTGRVLEPLEPATRVKSEDYPQARQDIVTTAIPHYRENPKPYYPRIARRKSQQGTVILMVEVLPDGRSGRVKVGQSSGFTSLDNAALKTVEKWSFIPGKRGNIPITMWVNVPIRFELKD